MNTIFKSSCLNCGVGLCRFEEFSRALYLLTVQAESQDVSIIVHAGQVNDISGNPNLASNVLNSKHCMDNFFLLVRAPPIGPFLFLSMLNGSKMKYNCCCLNITIQFIYLEISLQALRICKN